MTTLAPRSVPDRKDCKATNPQIVIPSGACELPVVHDELPVYAMVAWTQDSGKNVRRNAGHLITALLSSWGAASVLVMMMRSNLPNFVPWMRRICLIQVLPLWLNDAGPLSTSSRQACGARTHLQRSLDIDTGTCAARAVMRSATTAALIRLASPNSALDAGFPSVPSYWGRAC